LLLVFVGGRNFLRIADLGLDSFRLVEFPDFADIRPIVVMFAAAKVVAAAGVVVVVVVVVVLVGAAAGDNAVEVDVDLAVVALTDHWQIPIVDGEDVLVT
jgi:hypothetical protein